MAKTLANYDPLVQIPSGMTPAGADFPIVESHDILVGENDKRLDAKLDDIDNAIGNVGETPIATQLSSKVNTGDIVTSVAATGSTSNNKIPSETAVRAAIEAKTINVDSTVTEGSTNAVSGGAVHTQLATKQNVLTFDSTPTASSNNPVTSGGVKAALDTQLATKQDALTFDTTPTASSNNPVTSGGVKAALDTKQNTLTYEITPIAGSVNPVTSTGIRNAIDAAAAGNLGQMQAEYTAFTTDIRARVSSLSNGMVACSNIAAETTVGDTRILLYTGTTNSTYTNGHWYYNSAPSNQAPSWTDGGAVGSAPTIDNTLTTAGAAADSKSVGDAIENIVTISNTQPGANSGNKVWIRETTDEEVQIPTYEEHISKANKADITTNNESDNGSGTITASKAYAIGDHFYINNTNTSSENYGVSTLYKATAAIASGSAIVVGTNCEASRVADEITSLSNDIDTLNESLGAYSAELYDSTVINDWSQLGTNTYPLGWAKGYYGASNGKPTISPSIASHYIRTLRPDNLVGGKYKPNESVTSFVASAPSPFAIAVFEYAEDDTFVVRHGNMKSTDSDATQTVSVQHTAGHTYNFSVGYLDNYENYVADSEFISTINVTEYTSKIPDIEMRIADTEEMVGSMQEAVDNTTEALNNKNVVPWINFGTLGYPQGWRIGYYSTGTGAITQNTTKAICQPSTAYIPPEGVKKFTVEVPDGYSVLVTDYDFDEGYSGYEGSVGSGSDKYTKVSITPSPNHYYKFSVGWFDDGTAEQHLDTSFTNQIILTEEYYADAPEKKHLNILLFGNSYFADSWAYVPFILKKYGITCNIHFYYRGSGSVDRLVAEWEDTGRSGLDDFGISHVRRYAHIDTRFFRAWEQNADYIFSPKQVLEKVNAPNIGKWDIIVLSAGSRSQSFTVAPGNGDPRQGAEPYIRQAINLINASYDKPYHLAWFGLYTSIDGYAGNPDRGYPAIPGSAMDNRVGVLKSTETIMSAEPFDIIFPAGTAVFNARTNASLASTELSAWGNLWCPDKIHLHAGIPNYIANCAVVQSIFKKFYPDMSILGDDTRITDALISKYNCPFITSWCGSVLDDTELLYELGQKAAIMACEHPYDITPIYSPTDTTQLEWLESHANRYWADALIDTSNIV